MKAMNRQKGTFAAIASALLMTVGATAQQQDAMMQEYRITAYKKGNAAVYSLSNTAEISTPLSIYVPNAFTPNNDGINDRFEIKGEGISSYHLMIFDRWGNMLFETDNPGVHWDGTYRGETVQQDVYVYDLTVGNADNYTKKMRGSVTLINY